MAEAFLSSSRQFAALFSCCILYGLTLGSARASSLLFVACLERFDIERKEASFPFALCYVIRNIAGPFTGYLSKAFAPEHVTLIGCFITAIGVGACFFAETMLVITISWGLVFGLGMGLGSLLIPEILLKYFEKHFDKAMGFSIGGECILGFLLPIIVDATLNTYGTDATFLILSAIILNSVPASMILINIDRRRQTHMAANSKEAARRLSESTTNQFILEKCNARTEKEKKISDSCDMEPCNLTDVKDTKRDSDVSLKFLLRKNVESEEKSDIKNKCPYVGWLGILLDPVFILILLSQSASIFIFTTSITIIIDYSNDVGIAAEQDIYILMGIGISDTIGRFTLGFITDSGYMSNVNFNALCLFIQGLVLMGFIISKGFSILFMACCLFGIAAAGPMATGPGIASNVIEKENLKMVLASRTSLFPFMGLAQPFLIEHFRETLGSYNGLLLLLSGISFACAILNLLIPVTMRLKESRKRSKTKEICTRLSCQ